MFGLKLFTQTKTKRFTNEKERKRYFAIQDFYKKKSTTIKSKTESKKTRKS